METFLQDTRFGVRLLCKSSGLSAAVILALALGIGANTATFSVVYGVLLKPLPYRAPDRLALIFERNHLGGVYGVASADFLDWSSQAKAFDGLAGWSQQGVISQNSDRPQHLWAGMVTPNFFPTLGVKPSIGRLFLPDEGGVPSQSGPPHVVLLTHRIWKEQFGSDPNILGRSMTLDNRQYSIIGVLPPDFKFISRHSDIYLPITLDPHDRGYHYVVCIGRLHDGRTMAEAITEMASISSRLDQDYPKTNHGWIAYVNRLEDWAVQGSLRQTLWLLLGAVGFVLLIACVNIASLLLSRSAVRQREIAIRTSLGAGRRRLIQQMLTESLVFSISGGVAGLALAWVLVGNAGKLLPAHALPSMAKIEINPAVMLFTLAVSVLTGILFGLAPALQASAVNLVSALKDGTRSVTSGKAGARLRSAMLVGEIALAILLMMGASLMVQSFIRLQNSDLGFRPQNVLAISLTLQADKYSDSAHVNSFLRQVLERVQSLPGVSAASFSSYVPAQRAGMRVPFEVEGAPPRDAADLPDVAYQMISSGYLRALGIPLLRGRALADSDGPDSARVVLVNQAFARRYFPNGDVLGHHLRISAPLLFQNKYGPLTPVTIEGVIGDVWAAGMTVQGRSGNMSAPAMPEIYVPYTQSESSAVVQLAVRTARPPSQMTAAVRQAIEAVDKSQPINRADTLEGMLADVISEPRFRAQLMSVFSILALTLAAIGIYGVSSFTIAQRTHEFGIRMALGAGMGEILRIALGPVLVLAGLGILIGVICSVVLGQAVNSLLYGVRSTDPLTIAGVSLFLAALALIAGLIPAHRAASVDPITVLRQE
jgi:putative ABC transport system permease protein